MGAMVFLVIFLGGWIVLGRYWWRTSRHRVLSVLGAGMLCFVVGGVAGTAVDGALTSPPVVASTPTAPSPAAAAAPSKPAPAASVVAAPTAAKAAPAAAEADPPNVFAQREALEKKALAGDYQAQRNLAYSLGHDEPTNTMQACAWRIVILGSGSAEVDDSDLANKRLDCNRKLAADALYAAGMRAVAIGEKIDARRK